MQLNIDPTSQQAGYLLISIPVFFGDVLPPSVIGAVDTKSPEDDMPKDVESDKVARRTENYISNRRLLLALAHVLVQGYG